ncbi:hypothetical protein [Pseudonocardia sp. NPDC049154]|uniref:hypothetical protein n=1 Tax=Pseudonocardia sp. NPDC049154 TaxID=3155501 RepID=UPI0033D14D4A
METLPTILGALPDLGIASGVVIVVIVAWKILGAERENARKERDYFTSEREKYRAEASADKQELKDELAAKKQEIRELEARLRTALFGEGGGQPAGPPPPYSPPSPTWGSR